MTQMHTLIFSFQILPSLTKLKRCQHPSITIIKPFSMDSRKKERQLVTSQCVVCGEMHSDKKGRSALLLNALYSGKKWWIQEFVSPFVYSVKILIMLLLALYARSTAVSACNHLLYFARFCAGWGAESTPKIANKTYSKELYQIS